MMLKRPPTNRFIKVFADVGRATITTKPARWPSGTGQCRLAMGGRVPSDTAAFFEVQRYVPRSTRKPPPALADGKTCTFAVRCRRGHDSVRRHRTYRGVRLQLVGRQTVGRRFKSCPCIQARCPQCIGLFISRGGQELAEACLSRGRSSRACSTGRANQAPPPRRRRQGLGLRTPSCNQIRTRGPARRPRRPGNSC